MSTDTHRIEITLSFDLEAASIGDAQRVGDEYAVMAERAVAGPDAHEAAPHLPPIDFASTGVRVY